MALIFSIVGGVIVLAILILVILAASRPGGFRIERSITIAAPPEVPFAQVNDLHKWADWSPWEKMDPQLRRSYEGPSAGVGAKYAWAGNKKVGEGRMTIAKSEPSSLIALKLEFLKPFAATNTATFTFTPTAGGTTVNWGMDGCNEFAGKLFSLLMNMDKMIGRDFEKGLAAMKSISESQSKAGVGV